MDERILFLTGRLAHDSLCREIEGLAKRGFSYRVHELGLQVAGLMTVAPFVDDAEQVRPVFRRLRELAEAHGLVGLSMGMTGDYRVAVEEGASAVRLGRVLFGERRA